MAQARVRRNGAVGPSARSRDAEGAPRARGQRTRERHNICKGGMGRAEGEADRLEHAAAASDGTTRRDPTRATDRKAQVALSSTP